MRRVAEAKDEVYEESIYPSYLEVTALVPWGIISLLVTMNIIDVYDIFHLPWVLLLCIFLLVPASAFLWAYLVARRASFRGCRRNELFTELSYLDAKESGVTEIGNFMPTPNPGSQFMSMSKGANSVWEVFSRLQSTTSLVPSPCVDQRLLKSEIRMTKYLAVMIFLNIILLINIDLILIILRLESSIIPLIAIPPFNIVLILVLQNYKEKKKTS